MANEYIGPTISKFVECWISFLNIWDSFKLARNHIHFRLQYVVSSVLKDEDGWNYRHFWRDSNSAPLDSTPISSSAVGHAQIPKETNRYQIKLNVIFGSCVISFRWKKKIFEHFLLDNNWGRRESNGRNTNFRNFILLHVSKSAAVSLWTEGEKHSDTEYIIFLYCLSYSGLLIWELSKKVRVFSSLKIG